MTNVHLVSKDHEAVVGLASDGSAYTLCRMPHGIKGKEVILTDLKLVSQILQASLRERVTG